MSNESFRSIYDVVRKYTSANNYNYTKNSFNNLYLERKNKAIQNKIYCIIHSYISIDYSANTNRYELDTIIQDTAEAILRFEDGKKITQPLVKSIADNVLKKIIRGNRAKKRTPNYFWDVRTSTEYNDSSIEHQELSDIINTLLTPPYKEVVSLALQGLTLNEISCRVKKPPSTVNRIKQEGFNLIKRFFDK